MFGVIRGIIRGASRKQLTSKQGNKHYYKGQGTGSTGSHTAHGRYIIDESKIRRFFVPNLEGFKLMPYVSYKTEKISTTLNHTDFLDK